MIDDCFYRFVKNKIEFEQLEHTLGYRQIKLIQKIIELFDIIMQEKYQFSFDS